MATALPSSCVAVASQAAQRLAVHWLLGAPAIRQRCGMVLAAAERDGLAHFVLDTGRLDATADLVVDTIRSNYPDLRIPYHSRWRHFSAGGLDRWRAFAESHSLAAAEVARLRFELAITSVLLDAGAGPGWRYRETAAGTPYTRSEGLAVASFDLFAAGGLSGDRRTPQVDADGLQRLTAADLAEGFQVATDNPLTGLEGRVKVLHALGRQIERRDDIFGGSRRLGAFFDRLADKGQDGRIAATEILRQLTGLLAPVWDGRPTLGAFPLGDVWRHPATRTTDADLTSGFVPFHKLSQWLAYSLVEPLEDAGIAVTDLDGLTGLPEYRNGGLLIDMGVLRLREPGAARRTHRPGDELVVEWRALTVMLLDRIAGLVRSRLGCDAESLPLAKVLEGGTWAAGRRIAREKRSDGGPPLAIESDGTVF